MEDVRGRLLKSLVLSSLESNLPLYKITGSARTIHEYDHILSIMLEGIKEGRCTEKQLANALREYFRSFKGSFYKNPSAKSLNFLNALRIIIFVDCIGAGLSLISKSEFFELLDILNYSFEDLEDDVKMLTDTGSPAIKTDVKERLKKYFTKKGDTEAVLFLSI